jgi:hypothetical protein
VLFPATSIVLFPATSCSLICLFTWPAGYHNILDWALDKERSEGNEQQKGGNAGGGEGGEGGAPSGQVRGGVVPDLYLNGMGSLCGVDLTAVGAGVGEGGVPGTCASINMGYVPRIKQKTTPAQSASVTSSRHEQPYSCVGRCVDQDQSLLHLDCSCGSHSRTDACLVVQDIFRPRESAGFDKPKTRPLYVKLEMLLDLMFRWVRETGRAGGCWGPCEGLLMMMCGVYCCRSKSLTHTSRQTNG